MYYLSEVEVFKAIISIKLIIGIQRLFFEGQLRVSDGDDAIFDGSGCFASIFTLVSLLSILSILRLHPCYSRTSGSQPQYSDNQSPHRDPVYPKFSLSSYPQHTQASPKPCPKTPPTPDNNTPF